VINYHDIMPLKLSRPIFY